MTLSAMQDKLWLLLGKYGTQMFVVNKTGSNDDLDELYAGLDGPHLLGFCMSGLIMEESLVPFDTW